MSALAARRPVRGTISARRPRDLAEVDIRPAGSTQHDADTVRAIVTARCDDAVDILAALGLGSRS